MGLIFSRIKKKQSLGKILLFFKLLQVLNIDFKYFSFLPFNKILVFNFSKSKEFNKEFFLRSIFKFFSTVFRSTFSTR